MALAFSRTAYQEVTMPAEEPDTFSLAEVNRLLYGGIGFSSRCILDGKRELSSFR
jgi:hypothetical protein